MTTRSNFSITFFVLLLFLITDARGQNTNFYLKNKDRVVFFGDSITEQSFYTNYLETYVVTRFPQLSVSFVNSGWSGDRVYGGGGGSIDDRLKRDVFPYKPTVMTVMFGMNDGCYVEYNADCYQGFAEGYERLYGLLKKDATGLRLTLLQPSPFDDWTDSGPWRLAPPVKGGYNNVLLRYCEFVKNFSDKNNLTSADMNAPLVDVIKKMQAADHDLAQKIIPDRIHPSAAGGLVMADGLLKAWGAPALVSAVALDARGKKAVSAENAKISDLKFASEISWTQTDLSLPLPLELGDKTLMTVARLTNVGETLNRQTLRAGHLSAPRYELKIDGTAVGSFTKEELTKGIDLSVLSTPMLKQALAVHVLTEQHNKIHYARWREVQVPFEKEALTNKSGILSGLDAMEAELVKKQHALALPQPHRFELIPQG